MIGSTSAIPSKNFVLLVVIFGACQLLFIFQLYYVSLQRTAIPTQCDCQCTKQLHISTGGSNLDAKEDVKFMADGKLITGDEEKVLKQILNAEDKKLDREWHQKNKNLSKEDPDEAKPYQEDVIELADDDVRGDNSATAKQEAKKDAPKPGEGPLTYRELKLNPDIPDNESRCYGDHSNIILFYVYSAPGHFNERNRIRSTWGSAKNVKGKELRVVFFIGGLSEHSQQFYQKIKNESRTHGDIVQDLSYIDAYRNLTLKGISAMQWVAKYCPEPYIVFKIDDDTLINPFQLVKFLSGQSDMTMSELICKVTTGVGPIRDRRSKYFVSWKEYGESYYPEYCQGYGYMLPPKVIPKILSKLNETKLIAMEDVLFTGLIREKISVKTHMLTALYSTTYSKFETFLERITARQELIVIGHVHEDSSAEVFWSLVKQRWSDDVKKMRKEEKKRRKK